MLASLRRAGLRVTVLSLDDAGGLERLRTTTAALVLVDTIAAAAATELDRLRSRGVRICTLALMERGAVALARRSERVIAVSRSLARDLVARGIARGRIAVVPPGIERARPAARTRSARALCVANWTRAKGIRTLLAAIELLADVRLDLVGDMPDPIYARHVRADLRGAPFRARVRVHGVVRGARLRQMYARASFFVLPSTVESYGMAVGDALAAGLPIIACDIPATREVTAGAALLVPRGRVVPLSAAIARVSSDADLRDRLARRARERATRLPTWEQSEREFVRAVRAMLASPRRSISARDAGARRTRAGRLS
jgi:glycosyltransferase involved in cell wall biosynthesis